MNSPKTHHATTAGSIAGWDIQRHLGVVAVHVVAGTGLISDFFAGFSDFFGGRSESYRKQLASLYDEAIARLLHEAHARGGNWLVGLRVDIEQVSGKGKQMFMITGMATAVSAKPTPGRDSALATQRATVSATEMDDHWSRVRLLKEHGSSSGLLPPPVLARATEARLSELSPAVLRSLAASQDESFYDAKTREESLETHAMFFTALPPSDASKALFEGLAVGRDVAAAAIVLMARCTLGDLASSLREVESENREQRRNGLQSLRAHQLVYAAADLDKIDRLRDRLDGSPFMSPHVVLKKGLLGGDRSEWECVCGRRISIKAPTCATCLRDQMGFLPRDLRPEEASELLLQRRSSLVVLLGNSTAGSPQDPGT